MYISFPSETQSGAAFQHIETVMSSFLLVHSGNILVVLLFHHGGKQHYLAVLLILWDLGQVNCVLYFLPTHSESVVTDWKGPGKTVPVLWMGRWCVTRSSVLTSLHLTMGRMTFSSPHLYPFLLCITACAIWLHGPADIASCPLADFLSSSPQRPTGCCTRVD